MNSKTVKATMAAFLHDLYKLSVRAGIAEGNIDKPGCDFLSELVSDSEILEAVNYRRTSQQNDAELKKDSVVYIIHMAKLISYGTNYKNIGETEKYDAGSTIPMATVFNILNGNNLSYCYRMVPLTEKINFPVPQKEYSVSPEDYKKLLTALKEDLKTIEFNEKYVDALGSVLEKHLSYVPANISPNELHDISLYDQSKITAAIGSSICEYLQYNEITDFRQELFADINAFLNKKAFIIFTGDLSGIQSFIYNVIADGALKSLRSRSFFLEMLMEHTIDEILSSCGLPRANLIYSGGGRCYILLPNTENVVNNINNIGKRINEWLRMYFGNRLFYSWAYIKCSANDLMNIPADDRPYEKIIRELNSELSIKKVSRYTAEEIRELNRSENKEGFRECSVCGTESNLSQENGCLWCERFVRISSALLNKDLIIAVSDKFINDYSYLTFPVKSGEIYYYLTDEKGCKNLIEEGHVKRIYTKNKLYKGLPYSRCLFMGDYVYSTLVEDLIDKDEMRRLGVLRADVDDLGQAFIYGFTRNSSAPDRYSYNTLSRTAAFSRQMNLFFKYYFNFIFENWDPDYNLNKKDGRKPRIVTVYSGGDDVFLVGNFRDLLEASVCINDNFKKFTAGTLTLSYGLGVFPLKYPIYKSADETAELEDLSKGNEGKDSISVFSANEDHTYKNAAFKEGVIGEKLKLLIDYFESVSDSSLTGKTLLHRLLSLLRNSDDKINLARCAYILAKMEPVTDNNTIKEKYKMFAEKMYGWITGIHDRKEIVTAIYIYLFIARERRE